MPEGHTIHRIACDHRSWFANQSIGLSSPQGRFESEAKKLNGSVLKDVTARGKHLFYHWGPRKIVHIHLGLYGKFRVHQNPAPEPRGAVRVRMIGQDRSFDLNGPTCCELISTKQYNSVMARLGQDPLSLDACPDKLWGRFSRSRSAIGTLLLNQSVIAGIGNVYRAEILFLLGIHPERPANQIPRELFDEMWKLSVNLLKTGVKYNRIITIDLEHIDKPASKLKAEERLNIYKQVHCHKCGGRVSCWELGSRKMYACLRCQKH